MPFWRPPVNGLRELQEGFFQAMVSGGDSHFGSRIRANGLSGDRRLQVYRNNSRTSLTGALAAVYPALRSLVGEGFFEFMAARYLAAHPSRSGNLHDLGGQMAVFLQAFEPTAGLPYLPDVARLEWAWHRVFHAAFHDALDPTRLADVAEENYDTLRFCVHPAARLLHSPYPVLRIWEVNLPGFEGDQSVNLDQGGDRLLVIRRRLEVEIERLAPGDYALASALAAGENFTAACEQALAAQPDLDLGVAFGGLLAGGALVDFTL